MCSFVGLGAGVNVGNGVGNSRLERLMLERLTGVDGIKKQRPIAAITRSKPIGRRKLRAETFRRVKMRRLDMP